MFDMHYDLLTVAYLAYKQNKLDQFKEYYQKVYNDENIVGGIVTLYFMSKEEMKYELKIENINVLEMFERSISVIKSCNLLNDNFIFAIEGCDYLEGVDDLKKLYGLGLRAILPVWNEKNKFGSGIRSDSGLTNLGRQLINEAIDLKIGIDLSHTNEKTFYDIIEIVKYRQNLGDNVCIYASHSNIKKLCDRPRNLTDNQIQLLKDVGGSVGILINKNFVSMEQNRENSFYIRKLIDNLNYAISIMGMDNVFMATDDMNFMFNYGYDSNYKNNSIFDFSTIKDDLKRTLIENNFTLNDINRIMKLNGFRLINHLKQTKN